MPLRALLSSLLMAAALAARPGCAGFDTFSHLELVPPFPLKRAWEEARQGLPVGQEESYVAVSGRPYTIRISDYEDLQASLMGAQIYALLGIPFEHHYPALVDERDTEPLALPLAPQDARKVEQLWRPVSFGPTLTPATREDLLTEEQKWRRTEDRALLAYTDYAFGWAGRKELQTGAQTIATAASQVFTLLRLPPRDKEKRILLNGEIFPWRELKLATVEQRDSFLRKLGAYLNQLEAIADQALPQTLGVIANAFGTGRWGARQGTQALLTDSLKQMRTVVENHLRTRIGGVFAKVDLARLRKPVKLLVPHLNWGEQSVVRWPSISDPYFARRHARELLYLYLNSRQELRVHAIEKWIADLGGKDPIRYLLEVARDFDGSTRWIGPRHPVAENQWQQEQLDRLQLEFHQGLGKTLFAYSPEDREGRLVTALLELLPKNSSVIRLPLHVPQGAVLSLKDYEQLREVARNNKVTTIVIGELGGVPAEVDTSDTEDFSLISDHRRRGGTVENPRIILLDHHLSQRTRWNKRSLAEQLFGILGFSPTPYDIATAILDRSGIPGLRELGVDAKQLGGLYTRNEHVKPVQDENGFYVLEGLNLSDACRQLDLLTYPEAASFILMRQKSIVIRGKPEVIERIDIPASHQRELCLAGDRRSSSYLILKETHSNGHALRLEDVQRLVREALSPASQPQNCATALLPKPPVPLCFIAR